MNRNRIYGIMLLTFIAIAAAVLWLQNDTRRETAMIREILPGAGQIKLMKEAAGDPFIRENFPAVIKVYNIDGKPGAFITSGTGYAGTISALVAIDNKQGKTAGVRILEQGDTPLYADPIKESWFTDRFKGVGLHEYLKLVVLDPEKPTDIVQVTGASVSSQAVLNNVNSAIGAWNYLTSGTRKEVVSNTIPQEMWEKDENSFLICWPEDNSTRVNVEELKEYSQVTTKTILQKTTGTKINIEASGPRLSDVLKKKGININDYEAIGITGRDNYYTMISKDILQNRQIILGIVFDGKEILREEKPIRVVVPDEMGVYWVKMVNRIELYKHISPKNIGKVHIFGAFTRDMEPYFYEYYGSKDKSYLVGKILSKFKTVDQNGFFTMAGSDGLVKNETISMVRDRYYIKAEGENAPMNISPAFKLGMNVKEMCYFSTTTDAVIFPGVLLKAVGGEKTEQGSAMKLKAALEEAGMEVSGVEELTIKDSGGKTYALDSKELEDAYMLPAENNGADIIAGGKTVRDVLEISKTKD